MPGRAKTTSRRGVYRRRLAIAAAASLALHLLLARGLALTSLGLGDRRPAAAAAEPRPKPRADFTIRTSRSPPAPPAHERPLAIAATTPTSTRSPAARPAARAAAERRPEEAAEPATSSAAAPAPRRDRALEAADAPDRAVAASAPEAATTAVVAAAPPAPLVEAAPAPAELARPRDTSTAVASRWRPREVALLERLTAPAPARPVTTRDGTLEGVPTSIPASRAVADARPAAATASADPVAAPAGDVDGMPTTTPAARAPGRAALGAAIDAPRGGGAPRDQVVPTPAGDATGAAALDAARSRREAARDAAGGGRGPGRPAVAASEPAGAAAPLDAVGAAPAAGAGGAAPAPAAGTAHRGGGARAIAGRATSGTAAPGGADGPPSGTAADARGIASVVGGGRRASADDDDAGLGAARQPNRAPLAAAAGGGDGAGETAGIRVAGGGPAPDGEPAAAPAPRAVGRMTTAVAGTPLPGAVLRRAVDPPPDEGADEAELSVPRLAAGAAAGRPRREEDDHAAEVPLPPRRMTVVVLPAESRVRDVAEAFARRGRDARRDRRDDPRAARADAVVDRGLEFLAQAQRADGRWSLGRFAGSGPADVPELASDTAATGLALLAFLGAGHDHFDGPRRDTVRRGLEFLLSVQQPDGDLYVPADELSNSCAWLYSHGIASIALCEAVGMTGDPLVRPAAARACGFIAATRHPERGGWRYTPRSDADLSVSGWMLVALRSGALAGVETDPRALAGVRTLLDAAASADDQAGYAYNPRNPDQRASELSRLSMTAVGALMRLHTGAKPDDPRVAAAARVLAARRPAYDARGRDSYLWYYASQVLVHTGGPAWDAWYADLVDSLAAAQETAGAKAGSWDPLGPHPDRWGRWGGRIYVTALHLLALEVPDRRLPTYTAGE